MGFEPKKHRWENLPVIGEVAEVGEGLETAYASKKWDGKEEHYLHEYSKRPKMYIHEDGKTLILHPIEYTEHGITS